MKILQVTNIISYHQLPLAKALRNIVGEDNFLYAAIAEYDESNIKSVGSECKSESWIIYPNKCVKDKEKFDAFWEGADIVICGERLISKMQDRVDNNKICFYMSERWLKPPIGIFRLCHPSYLKMYLKFRRLSKSNYFHYLPTGPFAARDMSLLTSMAGRIWKWGYFTEIPNIKRKISKNNEVVHILWVGRMLQCKRVDLLIKALHRLRNEGQTFRLTLIGEGPERERLKKLSDKLLGPSYCTIKNFVPAAEVPALMASYDIYVFPSNAYEGWGAVVNEAMSVGCGVISSNKTGAGATLIEHGVNGLLFKSGSVRSLYRCLNKLMIDRELNERLGINAKYTIIDGWQPAVVAERFIQLASEMLSNNVDDIKFSGVLERYR